ncbi:hypothetical protein [Tsukamurella pseudospumae]|uniref:Uncharacterized protein n=1 Tax=Tsukamurella pseudospumae TaxID=239498 RepID=A0A137ZQT8_9ACTN|nr:hypothetical protein [Tsukamurella pseudospumae]KXP00534.1 hypothetical protein AXK61_15195 [Tsukamurella pseudospumae]
MKKSTTVRRMATCMAAAIALSGAVLTTSVGAASAAPREGVYSWGFPLKSVCEEARSDALSGTPFRALDWSRSGSYEKRRVVQVSNKCQYGNVRNHGSGFRFAAVVAN